MSFKRYCESSSPPSFPCFSPLAGSESCWPFVSDLGCLQVTVCDRVVFVSFICFTVSHFPSGSGSHFSTTLFFCCRGRKKITSGDSRNPVPEAMGWHPLSPVLYSYLIFNCIFSRFSSTVHLPSSLTGRNILFLIQNAFLLISVLQKAPEPPVTCWLFSCWLICWPCYSLLPFQPFSPFLFPNLGQNLQPAVLSHLHYHYLQT